MTFLSLFLFCVSRANNVSITFSHVHLISERADRRQSIHVIVIVIYKDYWIIYDFLLFLNMITGVNNNE